MSDGNFNRNLLPYQNYQSGLRAGKAMGKTKALEALESVLNQTTLPLSTDDKNALITHFRQLIEEKLGV